MPDGNDRALGYGTMLRFPGGDVVERNLRTGGRRDIQIHNDQGSYQALGRDLAGGPGSGDQCIRSDDQGPRFGRRGEVLRGTLLHAVVWHIGEIDDVRISILRDRAGPPVCKEQDGEYEGVGDDETANSHECRCQQVPATSPEQCNQLPKELTRSAWLETRNFLLRRNPRLYCCPTHQQVQSTFGHGRTT